MLEGWVPVWIGESIPNSRQAMVHPDGIVIELWPKEDHNRAKNSLLEKLVTLIAPLTNSVLDAT